MSTDSEEGEPLPPVAKKPRKQRMPRRPTNIERLDRLEEMIEKVTVNCNGSGAGVVDSRRERRGALRRPYVTRPPPAMPASPHPANSKIASQPTNTPYAANYVFLYLYFSGSI
ncbi:unnamed protein product [Danaus chrysippus]|uniref:(African queen) hypothetical protein n=1 Tax=Danaus chrysippus TaxID=151541 RepID=A0A8J2MWR3_9NEOP|nr:unnamed protein product [Danaus chrysippus]